LFGTSASVSLVTTAAAGRSGTYAYGQNNTIRTPNIGGVSGFGTLIGGYAVYSATMQNGTLIRFLDNSNTEQCSVRMNGSGQLFFSRNGTNLGAGNPTVSTNALSGNTWYYIEFKAIFGTSSNGTCEVVVNGVTWLTLTSVTNATTNAKGWSCDFITPNTTAYAMDMYLLDGDGGANTTYLGDVTVGEIFMNGAGVNSAWSTNQGSFTLSAAANASGGTTQYTGTITNGASPTNAWQGWYFSVSGFTNSNNNGGPWLCTASDATHITLQNASGASETHAGTCAFQNPVQEGIHGGLVDGQATTNVGTRPGVIGTSENQYIFSNTTNQKHDFAHTTLALTGTIFGVIHRTLARKDDAGIRQIAQLCESTGTEEQGSTISLSGSYNYYDDVLETDPHTSAQWGLSGFNAATFGVKEIT
jgi:hypothetical protein